MHYFMSMYNAISSKLSAVPDEKDTEIGAIVKDIEEQIRIARSKFVDNAQPTLDVTAADVAAEQNRAIEMLLFFQQLRDKIYTTIGKIHDNPTLSDKYQDLLDNLGRVVKELARKAFAQIPMDRITETLLKSLQSATKLDAEEKKNIQEQIALQYHMLYAINLFLSIGLRDRVYNVEALEQASRGKLQVPTLESKLKHIAIDSLKKELRNGYTNSKDNYEKVLQEFVNAEEHHYHARTYNSAIDNNDEVVVALVRKQGNETDEFQWELRIYTPEEYATFTKNLQLNNGTWRGPEGPLASRLDNSQDKESIVAASAGKFQDVMQHIRDTYSIINPPLEVPEKSARYIA